MAILIRRGIIPTVVMSEPVVIFLKSGTTWAVPGNWNAANNSIECIGGGRGGAGGGGAGGPNGVGKSGGTSGGNSFTKQGGGGGGGTGTSGTAGGSSADTDNSTGGSVTGREWSIGFTTPNVDALRDGRAEAARITDRNGKPRITGLSVGMRGQNVDVVLNNTQINRGQRISLDGNQVIEHL